MSWAASFNSFTFAVLRSMEAREEEILSMMQPPPICEKSHICHYGAVEFDHMSDDVFDLNTT